MKKDSIIALKENPIITKIGKVCARAFRRLMLATEQFIQRNLTGHAATLTYSCILGAVPILAIIQIAAIVYFKVQIER